MVTPGAAPCMTGTRLWRPGASVGSPAWGLHGLAGGQAITVEHPQTHGHAQALPDLRLLAVGYRWERNHVAIRIHEAGVTLLPVQ